MASLFLSIRIQNELEQLGDVKYDPSAIALRGHEAGELMGASQLDTIQILCHRPNSHRLQFQLDLSGVPGFHDR